MLHVQSLNPIQAAEDAIRSNLNLPKSIHDGRIKTMNGYGVMRQGRSVYEISTKQFLDIASKPGAKVLEIGAAYGEVCLEALRNGCKDYTAVDLDVNHVKILGWIKPDIRQSLEEQITDIDDQQQDQFPGYFSNKYDIMDFEKYPQKLEDSKKSAGSPIFGCHTKTLKMLFEKSGFVVENCTFRPIAVEPYKLDGRERVMLMARK